jgi:hypothetical protein
MLRISCGNGRVSVEDGDLLSPSGEQLGARSFIRLNVPVATPFTASLHDRGGGGRLLGLHAAATENSTFPLPSLV